ncbi:MAG TPA: DegQ family serine endoprotease [Alphaproteobacteria bacterium]|nr:DegQ family serine endoprotease [Alphaproteobacteria bacterium]
MSLPSNADNVVKPGLRGPGRWRKQSAASSLIFGLIAATFFLAPALAAETPTSFAPLVKDVAPAVVNVSTTQKVQGGPMMDFPFQDLPEDSPFRDFFKRFFNGPNGPNGPMGPGGQGGNGGGRTIEQHSLGSGFIVDSSGYVVTNNHVVGKATDIDVTLTNGKTYKAKLIGRDQRTDLALLKIKADESLPAVAWGDSDKAQVGDWVVAVGNPFGLGGTVTAGIISARGRDLHEGPYDSFIQTDAAINRGNSGGPMFNMDGKVIGINSAIYSPNGGSVGIGFAIPSSIAKPVIAQLKEHGSVERGWLGVQIQQVTPEMAESLGLKKPEGALVASLTKDSPAKNAGLRQGDVIVNFNGTDIKDIRDLTRAVADTRPGTQAPVTVWRDGNDKDFRVDIAKAPETNVAEDEEQPQSAAPAAEETKVPSLGITLGALTGDARKELGLGSDVKGALVTDVDDSAPAAEQGIKPGDVIVKVGQEQVDSPKDAAERIAKAKNANQKAVLVLVNRRGNELFVALPFVPA